MTQLNSLQIPVDDSISYKIYVSKVVPLADVTVTANLEMLLSSNEEPQSIDTQIRAALNDFIDTDWTLLSPSRTGCTPGFERVRIQALARIPASENHHLNERAVLANRVGLEFGHISTSRTLPQDQAHQIIKQLWFDAVEKVTNHLEEFNRISHRQWRIGDIQLGIPGNGEGNSIRLTKDGRREAVDEPLLEFMESGLFELEKISLTAEVTLRSPRPVAIA